MPSPKDLTKYTQWKEKISKSKMGHISPRKGVILSDEIRKKMSESQRKNGNKPKNPFRWTGKKRKPFSDEWKKNISKAKHGCKKADTAYSFPTGNKHPNWINGALSERYGKDWTYILKRAIRERDNYVCQICKEVQKDKLFAVHHIDYNKKNCNPENLITLCNSCHSKTNANRNYWKEYFRETIEQITI